MVVWIGGWLIMVYVFGFVCFIFSNVSYEIILIGFVFVYVIRLVWFMLISND